MKASGRKILDWLDESLAHPHNISKGCLKIDENAKHLPRQVLTNSLVDDKKSASAKGVKSKYKVVIENKKYKYYCMVIGIIGTLFVTGTISYIIWSQLNINNWFELKTSVSFIPFFVFGLFWQWKYENIYLIFVYILQGKMGTTEKTRKENHATKVTKIPKTKRQKYGMNKTIRVLSYSKKLYIHTFKNKEWW